MNLSLPKAPLVELFLFLTILLPAAFSKDFNDYKVNKLAKSDQWKALLYIRSDSSVIEDNNFFIEEKFSSATAQLRGLLSLIGTKDLKKKICQFPARYLIIKRYFGLSNLSFEHCEELTEFTLKAPVESASVVFASENISLPSSMMGHLYLKISGKNKKKKVEHAISFYTDVEGFNFPKLIFESLITGKRGFYTLSPNREVVDKYLFEENRNVWNYNLKLDPFQKKILQYHLHELKRIKLTYYFNSFNCATLIQHILSILYPDHLKKMKSWVTPLDVVRSIYRRKNIDYQTLSLATRWKIKSLLFTRKYSPIILNLIKDEQFSAIATNHRSSSLEEQFLDFELASTYNNYLLENKDISMKEYLQNRVELKEQSSPALENTFLDFKDYKNPTKTKSTAQIYIDYSQFNREGSLRFGAMPASHFLIDDSRQYINESELQISNVSLLYNIEKEKLKLDEYILYSSTSLQASDSLTGGLSGGFKIGFYEHFESDLRSYRATALEGAIGKTYRLHSDFDIYSLVGAKAIIQTSSSLVPQLKLGFVFRGGWGMKTLVSASYNYDNQYGHHGFTKYKLEHIFDMDSYAVGLDIKHISNNDKEVNDFSLRLKKFF